MPQVLITECLGWQSSSFAAEVCGGSEGNSVFINGVPFHSNYASTDLVPQSYPGRLEIVERGTTS